MNRLLCQKSFWHKVINIKASRGWRLKQVSLRRDKGLRGGEKERGSCDLLRRNYKKQRNLCISLRKRVAKILEKNFSRTYLFGKVPEWFLCGSLLEGSYLRTL